MTNPAGPNNFDRTRAIMHDFNHTKESLYVKKDGSLGKYIKITAFFAKLISHFTGTSFNKKTVKTAVQGFKNSEDYKSLVGRTKKLDTETKTELKDQKGRKSTKFYKKLETVFYNKITITHVDQELKRLQ